MTEAPSSIYLDTNVFIDLIDGEPNRSQRIRGLFNCLEARRNLGTTSELTLAEVLAPFTEARAMSQNLRRELYLELIVVGRFIALEPITRQVLYESVNVRRVASRKVKLPDAIHLATAVRRRCTHVVSRDKAFAFLPDGMSYVDTDSLQLDRLIEMLA